MKRTALLALGILSLWPLIYAVLFFAVFAIEVAADAMAGASVLEALEADWLLPIPHLATMGIIAVLVIAYEVLLLRTRRVSRQNRPAWAAALVMANVVALPIFYYWYVWRAEQTADAAGGAALEGPGEPQKPGEPAGEGEPAGAGRRGGAAIAAALLRFGRWVVRTGTSPTWRTRLGVMSVLPLLLLCVAFAPLVIGPPPDSAVRLTAMAIFMLAMLLSIANAIYDMTFLFSCEQTRRFRKAVWVVLLPSAGALVFPLFWYGYFYRRDDC